MPILRGFIVWVIIMVAEFLHGILRVLLLQPYLGDLRARQIAVFTGSIIIIAIATVFFRWIRAKGIQQLIVIGLLWLVLTLGFEILMGRFFLNYSWERIVSDFNLLNGGLLPIGLLVLTASPVVAARIFAARAVDKGTP